MEWVQDKQMYAHQPEISFLLCVLALSASHMYYLIAYKKNKVQPTVLTVNATLIVPNCCGNLPICVIIIFNN